MEVEENGSWDKHLLKQRSSDSSCEDQVAKWAAVSPSCDLLGLLGCLGQKESHAVQI